MRVDVDDRKRSLNLRRARFGAGFACCMLLTIAFVNANVLTAHAQRTTRPRPTAPAAQVSARTLVIVTEPRAVVWVNEVRRGVTGDNGRLQIALAPGRHTLRVRAVGFAERTLPLLPAQRGTLQVRLTPTTDKAELLFQQAEQEREREKAIELYREALRLRPRFAAANVGLARALAAVDRYEDALEQVEQARRVRPAYAEASVVEGRILRTLGDYDGSLAAYRRALREARNFQPEAHTGMGLVHEEESRHEEAVASFRRAIAQLSDTEPILYELLGRNLERLERWREAADAYDKYLTLAPEGSHVTAMRSIVEQLRRQAAEEQGQSPD